MLASRWLTRGGGMLALLALLIVGVMRPVPAAPRGSARTPDTTETTRALTASAAGTTVGSGSIVLRGYAGESTPQALSDVVSIVAAEYHSVALRGDGTVVAWGSGLGTAVPQPVGLKDVTAVSTGVKHVLALKIDGTVAAWGGNDQGKRRSLLD